MFANADVVEYDRKQHLVAIQNHFDTLTAKNEFRAALDLIPEMGQFEADTVSLQSNVAEKWKKHILSLADKGEYVTSMREMDALHDAKLTNQTEREALREEVYFRSGQWAASQAKDQNKAIDLLMQWRDLARQSGSYVKQKSRAATVALEMARYLATDVGKDADFAGEINELYRIDVGQARSEACMDLLRGWITRNCERFDVSARLALLENWELVLPALSTETRCSGTIHRFFILATSNSEARDVLLRLRGESLTKGGPVAGYVSLNRALGLADPLVTALKAADELRVEPSQLAELLNRALAGLNVREATFYRAGEGLAAQYFLTDGSVKVISTRLDDFGYQIRLHPSFSRRLHELGMAAVFEGIEGERPVCALLVPVGAESFIRIVFSDRMSPAVQREFNSAKAKTADKPQNEAMNICLNILDVRDAELASHLGTEVFGQLISHVGMEAFVRGGGRQSLRAFHEAIPKGMQGFVILDRLAANEGSLVREADKSAHYPDALPEDVNLDRSFFGAAYALWEEPYFEIGIPLRDEGERIVSGILRVGLRSIPR